MTRISPWITLIALLPLVAVSGCGKSNVREEALLPAAPEVAPTATAAPRSEKPPAGTGAEATVAMSPASSAAPKPTPGPALRRIHFDFDQAALRPDARDILAANAEQLRAVPAARVRIEGHCDERGTEEYNLALSERRAMNAFQYLVDLGLDPERFEVVSYGKEAPLESGHTEAAWAQNRRAELVELRN